MVRFSKYENILVKRYNEKFSIHKNTIKSLGWDNKKNQNIRFLNILKIKNLKNCKSILDIGCGFGDLLRFLKINKIKLSYEGIDINKNFIEKNKKTFNKKNKFYHKSLSNYSNKKKPDIVACFGLLNYKHNLKNDYISKFILTAYKKSKKVCIIDFISDENKKKENFIKYHKIINILKIIKKISPNFALYSDYKKIPQKEFCIIMYKK